MGMFSCVKFFPEGIGICSLIFSEKTFKMNPSRTHFWGEKGF